LLTVIKYKMKKEIKKIIEIEEGINVDVNMPVVKINGPNGSVEKTFRTKAINVEKKDNQIIVGHPNATKKEKKLIGTIASHITNMLKGVKKDYVYEVQICSVHFPITVKLEGNKLIIKNFFGENKDREVSFKPNVKVSIQEDIIKITSPNKESAGETASLFEHATRLSSKDRRIFQDGLWIITKQKGKNT